MRDPGYAAPDAGGLSVPLPITPDAAAAFDDDCALLIVCPGFEDRSIASLSRLPLQRVANVCMLVYDPSLPENEVPLQLAFERLTPFREAGRLFISRFALDAAANSGRVFTELLKSLAVPAGEIWVDVSGMTMFAICQALYAARAVFPLRRVRVIYTEAGEYYPTRKQFEKVRKQLASDPTVLPKSLSEEMAETLILDTFTGFSLKESPTCLFLFAGYELHRSIGVVDHTNPGKLVLIYGEPEREELKWRVELARLLHSAFISTRETAEAVVSTLRVGDSVALLREYYAMLYDDHNIAIAPICGKMQAVSAFLFWEECPDVQLIFTRPVRYVPNHYSKGVGHTFQFLLPPTPAAMPFVSREAGALRRT